MSVFMLIKLLDYLLKNYKWDFIGLLNWPVVVKPYKYNIVLTWRDRFFTVIILKLDSELLEIFCNNYFMKELNHGKSFTRKPQPSLWVAVGIESQNISNK